MMFAVEESVTYVFVWNIQLVKPTQIQHNQAVACLKNLPWSTG